MFFSIGLLAMYLELMVTYRTYATCMPLFVLFEVIDFFCQAKPCELKHKKTYNSLTRKENVDGLYIFGRRNEV